jgi:hypothetical protein
MTPDEQTVERVAKAMAFSVMQPNDASADAEEYWKHTGDLTKHTWKTAARAAISAMPDTTQARNDALREAADTAASCAAHFERMRARSEPFLNSIDREHRHDAAMKGKGAEFVADHIRKMIKEPTT